MYASDHFSPPESAAMTALIAERPFAVLVSAGARAAPAVSHLPLLLEAHPDGDMLIGHFARANDHWRAFDGVRMATAVFSGPGAYISPGWYESKGRTGKAAPTWNYLAVHVEGRPRLVEEADGARAILARLTARFEAGRAEPWSLDEAPAGYIEAMLRGIVAFEMPIERIAGKWKLGQNKTEADRRSAAEGLEAEAAHGTGSEAGADAARIAALMRAQL